MTKPTKPARTQPADVAEGREAVFPKGSIEARDKALATAQERARAIEAAEAGAPTEETPPTPPAEAAPPPPPPPPAAPSATTKPK